MPSNKSLILLAGLLLAGTLNALPANSAQPVLTGEICDARVHALTSQIEWYDNVHKAEAEARKQGKLVFWMHILGKIDGAT